MARRRFIAQVCRRTCGETRFVPSEGHFRTALPRCFSRTCSKPERVIGWSCAFKKSSGACASQRTASHARTVVDVDGLVLHSDTGGPMKGSTMLATLQRLGVVPSFSRPHVSDDNPFSEALFRTLRYRPGYPSKPFVTLEQAGA